MRIKNNTINNTIYQTFKSGSKTYFYSSIFFPAQVKKDVFSLYSFVRKADNFVDQLPQQAEQFYQFKDQYYKSLKGISSNDIIIDSFVELTNRKNFDTAWVDSFFRSMEMDITKSTYLNMDESLEYIYGSAEVIGLMMSSIMDLETESYYNARHLGRAMQYINFIRDIKEDNDLNRTYLPLDNSLLKSLDEDYVLKNIEIFTKYIQEQINQYLEWQTVAEDGYKYIPHRYLIPIKTSADMYKWTAMRIYKKPLIVYKKKVKPSILRIIYAIIKNSIVI